MNSLNRDTILLIGELDFNTTPFIERNLHILRGKIEDAPMHFKNIRAIVVADYANKFSLISRCFRNLFIDAENFGIAQITLFHNDNDFIQIKAIQGATNSVNMAINRIYNIADITKVAEFLARHNPGPPANDVTIEPMTLMLEDEIKLHLRRSFYDCEKIFLERVDGGKASMHLFKVHAWLKQSEVGPLPLPFFAKIAGHREIEQEKRNYTIYTDHYIAFQYRPNLRLERCVKTKSFSSLVGNFVDDAISLRSALRIAHHSGILFSLFEKSLKGFRLQPIVSNKKALKGELAPFLEKTIKKDELLSRDDIILAAKNLGLASEVGDLMQKVAGISLEIPCITGPMHGDLHAGNVMVRGFDAILIDFYSIYPFGPLTADPINLELSLSFALGEKENSISNFEEWKGFVDEVYNPSDILRPLAISDVVPNSFTWLKRAIREIRHILVGCPCCHEEIKVVFACYLLRYARLADGKKLKDDREQIEFWHHAYALVIAERLIGSL